MLASAPRLNSADRPMKTSVLRQRKGSVRKQHLLSWAWQQGRGQVVEILQSEKQTDRYQKLTVVMGQTFYDQMSRSVESDSLRTQESQHDSPPCPTPAPGVH